jgi:hypothetical protein
MRMGRGPKGVGFFWPQFAKDFALMSVHGFVGTAPGAAIAMYAGHVSWWTLLAAGLMAAPCYALAWLFPWDIPMLGCYADSTKYDPPPTAELLWGAYVGGATVLAFS